MTGDMSGMEMMEALLAQPANGQDYDTRTMEYQLYLQTREGQTIRRLKLHEARYQCQICPTGRQALDVHHRTYERRGVEVLSDLVVLCRGCHALFHDILPQEPI